MTTTSLANASLYFNVSDDDLSYLDVGYFDYYLEDGELDVETYIAINLGPKHLDLNVAIPMTVFYCLLWICGMAGKVKPLFVAVTYLVDHLSL